MRIVFVYLIFSLFWIITSDFLLFQFVPEDLDLPISVIKGIVFVLISSILIYYLLSNSMDKLETYQAEIDKIETEKSTSQQHLEFMVNSLPIVMWQIDQNGVIKHLYGQNNMQLYRSLEKNLGKNIFDIYPDDSAIIKNARKALTGNSASRIIEVNDVIYESFCHPMIGEDQVKGALGIAIDVTDREKTKSKLQTTKKSLLHFQRMDLLGSALAKVSHDLNNQFTMMLGYIELMEFSDDTSKITKQLRNVIEKASTLPKSLLAYSKKVEEETAETNVQELMDEILPIIETFLDETIQFTYTIENEVVSIPISKIKLESIITNLISNSADAIERSGYISLSIDHVNDPETLSGQRNGKFVCIKVSDTGKGIPDELVTKIFDPFFTTKPMDKGSGLGLSIIAEMVENSNGGINVETKENKGTTFEIFIPIEPTTTKRSMTELTSEPKKVPKEPVSLIVIDDDPNILELIETITNGKVSATHIFEDTLKAFSYLSNNKDAVDVIVVDAIMPDFDGISFVKRVKDIYPDARFVMMSGYHGMRVFIQQIENSIFLSKPFTPSDLMHAIASVLEK